MLIRVPKYSPCAMCSLEDHPPFLPCLTIQDTPYIKGISCLSPMPLGMLLEDQNVPPRAWWACLVLLHSCSHKTLYYFFGRFVCPFSTNHNSFIPAPNSVINPLKETSIQPLKIPTMFVQIYWFLGLQIVHGKRLRRFGAAVTATHVFELSGGYTPPNPMILFPTSLDFHWI